jgi:hypothetical protein
MMHLQPGMCGSGIHLAMVNLRNHKSVKATGAGTADCASEQTRHFAVVERAHQVAPSPRVTGRTLSWCEDPVDLPPGTGATRGGNILLLHDALEAEWLCEKIE